MKFYVNIKGVSNKKIEKREYEFEETFANVQEFLIAMVKSEKKRQDEKLMEDDKFREVFPVKAESLEKATDNALQSFQDGLFALFVDDKKYEKLDEEIDIHEGSEVTFVRLTFLAGRMW